MEISIGSLRNVEIRPSRDGKEVVIRLTEMDGSFYGSKTKIKIPAKSYEMLEAAIVEDWLEKKKSQV